MKQLLIIIILALTLCSCQNETQPKEELPNIILLVGDDQGYPYFGFMGANYVETPNMDKLAASGTLFTNGYVPANHCRPSLQALMTGTLPIDYENEANSIKERLMQETEYNKLAEKEQADWKQNFQFHRMKHFQTLPKILAEKGYKSFQGGKWWEFNYQNGGFDEGMTTGWTEKDKKNGGKWFLQFMGGEGRKLARATMQPAYDFIDKNANHPMFIWFAPELPHYPFDAPDKYYNIYKDKDMSESAKRYYANCTWFDDGVGELIRYLKEKGEFENTLFVYVNDNGWEQAPHQEYRSDSMRWHNGGDKGKLSMYDMSFRTPIIFSWQGKIDAFVSKSDLMHSADIPATILDYIGIETPNNYFGYSYKPVIEGDNSNTRDIIIGKADKVRSTQDMMGKDIEGYWLRTQDWFFNWDMKTDEKMLFDMTEDPNNDANIAESKKEVVQEFSNKVLEWKKQHGR
jgi:uncharacterized sulfatase